MPVKGLSKGGDNNKDQICILEKSSDSCSGGRLEGVGTRKRKSIRKLLEW